MRFHRGSVSPRPPPRRWSDRRGASSPGRAGTAIPPAGGRTRRPTCSSAPSARVPHRSSHRVRDGPDPGADTEHREHIAAQVRGGDVDEAGLREELLHPGRGRAWPSRGVPPPRRPCRRSRPSRGPCRRRAAASTRAAPPRPPGLSTRYISASASSRRSPWIRDSTVYTPSNVLSSNNSSV